MMGPKVDAADRKEWKERIRAEESSEERLDRRGRERQYSDRIH